MGITIIHLEGPLAGRVQEFDDSVELITFGRSPECLVVYPPECAEVGRRHFALRRARSGDYLVELFTNRFVAIDGIVADNGMLLVSGSLIALGRPNGPRVRVEFHADMRDVMAEIAWSADEAEDDVGESISRNSTEPFETAVDLLFKRRAEPPALTAGVPAGALAAHGRPKTSRSSSRSRGVGSGVPPQSRPPESRPPPRSLGRVPQVPPPDMTVDAAPQMRARTRRGGMIWWIVAAAALAALGYFLYRREIVLGAALGKLLQAAAPPPPTPKHESTDLIDVSVFGPTAIQAGGEGLIQVFLHHLSQREIAKALAHETDPDATRRGLQTLATEIAEGQHVQIVLDARGLDVDQEMQTLIWRSEPCACQFTLTAPEEASGRTFHPRVLMLVDSVPVGSLSFALKVSEEETAATELRLRGDRARRYSYAFLSYASPDRAEVIKRAQGLKAGGTNFFNDLLSLEPGERWEKRLYEEIDRCDVFYLFWSSRAKASEWVMKEVNYALDRSKASANGGPDIIPVIIEGPPPPAPPESLRHIHFNDSLAYVLVGIERPPPVAS